MKKEWLVKTLALGIVVLFIGVSCSSAVSVDTKTSVINNQNIENKSYVDPNIHLTKTNLPMLKRSFSYFRNSNYYDAEIGKVMEQIIKLIEFKGSVNSEDVENILINSDVAPINIHIFCKINGEGSPGIAWVFPFLLLEFLSLFLRGFGYIDFFGFGGFLYWVAGGNPGYSTYIIVGKKTYTVFHKGYAFGYFGCGYILTTFPTGYGEDLLRFYPSYALIAIVTT
jgi:hypothetical protein